MSVRRGPLSVHVLPMLSQDDYDRLLWLCDCNFVRGEDSFVRAQWAERPLVWQAYVQEEDAHHVKVGAFLQRYRQTLPKTVADDLQAFWQGWNQEDLTPQSWSNLWRHRTTLLEHAHTWSQKRQETGDLASHLIEFCGEKWR